MIWMSRRRTRSASASSDLTFLPSKWISPEVGSIRRSTQRPVVDLPQPDLPTSPRVSPGSMVKIDAVDRVHAAGLTAEQAAGDRKFLGQVPDPEQRLTH